MSYELWACRSAKPCLRQAQAPCSWLAAHCSQPQALGIGAASFASVSGTSFGDGDEVTEPVEVPRSDFEKRDENMASKDIAESPTAIAGTPKSINN